VQQIVEVEHTRHLAAEIEQSRDEIVLAACRRAGTCVGGCAV
jgi:hypothetical protein